MRWCLLLVPLALFTIASPADAQDVDRAELESRFIGALQQRGLDDLLGVHATRLLALPSNDSSLVGLETVLAEVLTRQGTRTTDPNRRKRLWERSDKLYEQAIGRDSAKGDQALKLYEWSGLALRRSGLMWDLSKVLVDDPAPVTAAREQAEQALRLLQQAGETTESSLLAGAKASGELDRGKLQSLSAAIRFRRGAANLALARATDDVAAKRAALDEVDKQLTPYAKAFGTEPITMESFLTLAEAAWLRHDAARALELLKPFEGKAVPEPMQQRARRMRAKLLLEASRPAEAIALLRSSSASKLAGPEEGLVLFEALLAQAARVRASNPNVAAELQDESLAILDDLEVSYGGYWARRGEQILARLGTLDEDETNLTLLRRVARILERQKEYEKALATYDRAARQAATTDNQVLAVEMAQRAGALRFELGEYADAAKRLRRLAASHPSHAQAPKSLLTAAYSLARLYGKESDDRILEQYESVLREHQRRYPNDETASEVRWLLGELAERRKNWPDAIAQYRGVSASHTRFPKAVTALASIYHDQLLGANSDASQATARREAAAVLEGLLDQPPAGSGSSAIARYVLARLWSSPGLDRDADAIALLGVLTRDPKLPDAIKGRTWDALLRLHLRRGETEQAIALVEKGFPDGDAVLLRTVSRIDPLEVSLSTRERAAQAGLVKAVAKRMLARPEELSRNNLFNLRLLLARAYVADGSQEQARRLLKRLAADSPNDPRIAMTMARNELAASDPTEALKLLSALRDRLKRGGDAWFEAVYFTIECYRALGQTEKAAKWLAIIQQLYPGFGGGKWKEPYERLIKELAP
ncbi:Anaphase-promoting complex, cyclosome, subunit 3 [Planctomycetes bacterium Pan216]|uniref:Anaphase-promoting complex, cyclosome, subunit 3 n=1 Tax=Kolteria novifilia TaxID=2527975 RepID=A0A518B9A6_9BACT|nr:Anaphase-promoting complex, cyclosome, subunit 3 [Planctomycetes bacterium Pan216]